MKDGFTLIELLVILLIVFLVGAVFLFPLWFKWSQLGRGQHTGYVTAIDERGYIWKNYDVYFKTDNSSSQEDTYCVHRNNQELAQELKEASQNRQQITITYEGVRGVGLAQCHATEILSFSTDEN